MNHISVNEALRVGRRNASLRLTIAFYLVFIPSGILILVSHASFYFMLLSIPIAFFVSVYSMTNYLYRWQVWAFENVRNVHELRQKAEKFGLIPSWEKMIFPPSLENQLANERLLEKLKLPDLVPDDSHLPKIFEVYYSKTYNQFQFLGWSVAFLGLTLALAILVKNEDLPEGILPKIFLGGIWLSTFLFSIENLVQLRSVHPVLTFTAEGVKVKRLLFKADDLKDIEILNESKLLRLKFYSTRVSYPLEISDLDIDVNRLEDIVDLFLTSWKKNATSNRMQ